MKGSLSNPSTVVTLKQICHMLLCATANALIVANSVLEMPQWLMTNTYECHISQLQTYVHPPNHHGEVPNISSSVEISNSGTKEFQNPVVVECGSKSSINQQSAIQRKGNQNPDESGSESDHQISTNANHKPNQATVCAEVIANQQIV